jgi:hypothetical protein
MRLIIILAASAGLAACATYGPDRYGGGYGDYRYEGSAWAGRHGARGFRGPGADMLDPWLAETPEGRSIVRAGWRDARDGRIGRETAHRANVWFRRHADADRDLCLTDAEIRSALAQGGWHIERYRRSRG